MALVEKNARADQAPPAIAGSRRSVDRSEQSGSTAMVLVVAVVLVGAALFFLMIGRDNAYPYVIGLLALLAVCGVFSLFAYAAGILRFATEDGRNDFTKAMVDSAGDALVVSEPSGRVLYANPAYLAMTGATGDEDVRSVERAFTGAPEVSEAIYRLSQAAREGRRHQEEVRRPGAEDARWLRLKVRPMATEGVGRLRGVGRASVWTVEDITRDRQSAETAFETLQKAIDFLDHAPAGFFSMEPNGEIAYMNATLAGWLDHDLTEVGSGGLALADILAADAAALLRTVPPKPGEVTTATFDLDLKRRGGEALPVRLLHKVAFSADGTPGSSRTLVINRGRSNDTGDSLRAAEVRFARFFNSSPLGIVTVDRDGQVGRANPIFARLLADVVPAAEAGSRSIQSLVKESSRPALSQAIGEAAAGKGDLAAVDGALQGDANRFAHFFVAPVDDPEQPGEAAIVYVVETTELRQLQEQFAQSQKMNAVGQLAGGVAHDFNNVLQAIIGHADLLLMDHKPADPSFNDVMQIKQNANRAASLAGRQLAGLLAQADAAAAGRPARRCSLRPLHAAAPLARRARRASTWSMAVTSGRCALDVTQLEQVILNLAVNARDAMPDGGKLTIRTANVTAADVIRHRSKDDPVELPESDAVMIEVTDTGTGIPDDIKQKIFDPFFSTKEVGKGTGLGLSTVYGIIKQIGRLRLRRQPDGPRHDVPHLPAPPCRDGRAGGGGSGRSRADALGPGRDAGLRRVGGEHAGGAGGVQRGIGSVRSGRTAGRGRTAGAARRYGCRNHSAGRGRGSGEGFRLAGPDVPRLHGPGGRLRGRGAGGDGRTRRHGRPRRLRRCHAGDERPDAARRAAQVEPGHQGHLRLRLCRGGLQERPAGGPGLRLPAEALLAQAAHRGGEGAGERLTRLSAAG